MDMETSFEHSSESTLTPKSAVRIGQLVVNLPVVIPRLPRAKVFAILLLSAGGEWTPECEQVSESSRGAN